MSAWWQDRAVPNSQEHRKSCRARDQKTGLQMTRRSWPEIPAMRELDGGENRGRALRWALHAVPGLSMSSYVLRIATAVKMHSLSLSDPDESGPIFSPRTAACRWPMALW